MCQQHETASGGLLPDVVVPIAYAIKREQHAHNLAAYKYSPPSTAARTSLTATTLLFLRYHLPCLTGATGGPFTHLALVPSTKGRSGEHPVVHLLGHSMRLPRVAAHANHGYGPDDRQFHADRFVLAEQLPRGARVLLVDDTWTTGSRVESLGHLLKASGAISVVTVVIGRHINPDYGPSKPILSAIRNHPYDPARCAAEDL